MACISNVYKIQNPLWNCDAELGEAAYGDDLDPKVGVFDSPYSAALHLESLQAAQPQARANV